MRALSLRQISNCEMAREKVCRCRCGGVLHGAFRGDGEIFFASLPTEDPHHFATKAEKVEQKRLERQARDERRFRAMAEVFGGPK